MASGQLQSVLAPEDLGARSGYSCVPFLGMCEDPSSARGGAKVTGPARGGAMVTGPARGGAMVTGPARGGAMVTGPALLVALNSDVSVFQF